RSEGAVLRSGDAGVGALRRRSRRRAAIGLVGADVLRARQTERHRSEQLDDVRRTDCAVVACTQANIPNGSQLCSELVGVGAEVVIPNLVIRITIAAGNRELLDERVADDRDLDFAEKLAHVERTLDGNDRAALAGEVAGLE